ncbi:MAG: hypothetical protein PHE15_03535 [Dehalococcoidales bacterium]|nr:hypothetical protein [Dehalococcoidales bacterium]
MIPNILFSLKKPVNIPSNLPKEPVLLVILENLGRYGVFIIPVFYGISFTGTLEILAV